MISWPRAVSARRIAELAAEAGLPAGVLNVVPGPGGAVGTAILVQAEALREAVGAGGPELVADGGRIERRAGGRVTHEDKADQLIAAADRAKRHINRKTEPLLQTPDEAVAKALAVANQAIGD